MDKRTLLAVALSIVVISAFYLIQGTFFPPKPKTATETVAEQPGGQQVISESPIQADPVLIQQAAPDFQETGIEAGPASEQRITINTGLATVVLSNAGGDVVSYKLNEHNDREDFVEMVLPGTKESHAFTVALGGINAQPLSSFFNVTRVSNYIVEFYRDFAVSDGGQVRLTKRFDFRPDEYMFELTVTLDGGRTLSSLNFSAGNGSAAYTLGSAPQFGPRFEKLDQRYEYRRYYTFTDGKFKTIKVNNNNPSLINPGFAWGAVAGKYFALIAMPLTNQVEMAFSTRSEPGIPDSSRLYLIRPAVQNGSRVSDVYRFYLGPKSQNALGVYDTAANSFKLRDTQLIKVANTSGFLGPLESLLKWLLMLFYRIIPNYGAAIILLTILVKAIMFPLTKKGSESTLRMQSLSPKIKEIQDKYKDNPQKMNAEMGELYKKEGYNPLSGCLPMIIQLPIFFAMYNLFNTHFDLRGAMFIPGWIPDLSLPESIWTMPFKVPLLGWSNLRVLPFLYVGSQLLYGKVTQTPDQQGNAQMKMMLYVMPIMFFFILYDVPSGLLLYWIMSNVLTMVQQLTINKYLAKKKSEAAAANPTPIIAPHPKKKKKRG
ncbi:inner membrane protein OxaA [Treponema primitia ZAS-2]|uniref:Membrane protein insertase YidC n=1 Tax=Treponema primitia (strain ATCC BAA-887 / DSM 12427 / ZAS-2) TaxID=545694 RepID=F5YLD6_TREPZ|nr:membrane protein insertase YidC [Treponema primitia]AEF87003.1 inner membrane protein OxaA [Treponema primitia ZAS-2]